MVIDPSPYLSPPAPRVFAHRGLATHFPENTLGAFRAAVDAGCSYVETDVHGTSDGVAVIAHDPDLTRVAGRPERIRDLSLAELGRIDLGRGQGFSSLADALAAFPELRFNIDIKDAAAVSPAADAILHAGAVERVLVTSFSESRRAATIARLPGVASSASAGRFAGALLAGRIGATPLSHWFLRDLVAVQVPERALGIRVASARMLRHLHSAGVEVHIWTVNDPVRIRELFELGVDGIVTDRADLALTVVAGMADA